MIWGPALLISSIVVRAPHHHKATRSRQYHISTGKNYSKHQEMAGQEEKGYVAPPSIGHELGVMFGFIGTFCLPRHTSPTPINPLSRAFRKENAVLTYVLLTRAHDRNDGRLRDCLEYGVSAD